MAPADAEPDADEPALPYLRPAVLLWLATLGESEWVGTRRPGRTPRGPVAGLGPPDDPRRDGRRRRRPASVDRAEPARRVGPPRGRAARRPSRRGVGLLEAILLGAAYPLGLVRVGRGSRDRATAWCSSRRWAATSWRPGPTPPPRPTFEQFLFVQPNFEVIAYRQGLTPQLVGRLSRFAWWAQIGAALELRLTRESILFGLDGGLTPEAMLELLKRHSQRALPSGVVDAVRTWATHRERVTYYAAATLIEFASARRAGPGAGVLAAGRCRPGSRAADRRRRSVPAGRGRADDPVRPVPDGRLARLPTAAGRLRRGRARRRLDDAGPVAIGPDGRRRARPVRRRAAGDRPIGGAGPATVRGDRRVAATGAGAGPHARTTWPTGTRGGPAARCRPPSG